MKPEERKAHRTAISLQVEYRTTGSFLMSYSLNLSKGGIFIETPDLPSRGTKVAVRFSVPNCDERIEAAAHVMWIRKPSNREGLPPGVGLQFDNLEKNIGAVIDSLAQRFSGMRLIACGGSISSVDRLSRYLKSVLNCEVNICAEPAELPAKISQQTDLVVIDLDSTGEAGADVLRDLSGDLRKIPIVALTTRQLGEQRIDALNLNAVLKNPPPIEQLKETVLQTLSRPTNQSRVH